MKGRESTARCKLEDYVNYLVSEPLRGSYRRMGEVLSISHDNVNRFIWREDYKGENLFEEIREKITLEGGILSIDDTVIDKPYSKEKNFESFVGHYGSGKHKRLILGINLVALYYKDTQGIGVPINFRIYELKEITKPNMIIFVRNKR